MAPPRMPTLPPRERTIANIAFITTPPGAKVDIVTSNCPESSEPWRAIAVQSGRVRRTQVLSAGGRTEDEAMLALHTLASRAVHQFLMYNGPGYPPAYGPEFESDTDEEEQCFVDEEQEAEAMSDWGDALSDESDGEGEFATSRRQHGKAVRGRRDQKTPTSNPRKLTPKSRQTTVCDDAGPMDKKATPKRRRDAEADMARSRIGEKTALHSHDQPADVQNARASEPQNTGDTMKRRAPSKGCGKIAQATTVEEPQLTTASRHLSSTQAAARQISDNAVAVEYPMPMKTTQQTERDAQPQATAQTPAQYPVRLTISTSTSHSLAHHSPVYQLITTLPAPSMRALVGSAVGYIRTMPIPGVAGVRPVPTLRARVKRVRMDDVMWDMGGFRADDLTIFFPSGTKSGDQAMPLFELEVEDATGAKAASPFADEYAGVLSG